MTNLGVQNSFDRTFNQSINQFFFFICKALNQTQRRLEAQSQRDMAQHHLFPPSFGEPTATCFSSFTTIISTEAAALKSADLHRTQTEMQKSTDPLHRFDKEFHKNISYH